MNQSRKKIKQQQLRTSGRSMHENRDDMKHSSKSERNALERCSEERTTVSQFCINWDKALCK